MGPGNNGYDRPKAPFEMKNHKQQQRMNPRMQIEVYRFVAVFRFVSYPFFWLKYEITQKVCENQDQQDVHDNCFICC